MHTNIVDTITNQDVTITGAMITGTREDIITRNHIHHNLLMKKRDSTAGKADVTKSRKRVSRRSLKRRGCRPNDLKTSNRAPLSKAKFRLKKEPCYRRKLVVSIFLHSN